MDRVISHLKARILYDRNGVPTVEAEVVLADGTAAAASVPSLSGTAEAETAVECINEKIADELIGMDALEQALIDRRLTELDGTPQKKNLGINALMPVSMAVCKGAAASLGMPLYRYLGGVSLRRMPVPAVTLFYGGPSEGNGIDIRELMAVPVGAASAAEAVRAAAGIHNALKKILGGSGPVFGNNRDLFQVLNGAAADAGYKPGEDVMLILDMAAEELYRDGRYAVGRKAVSGEELAELYAEWGTVFPILAVVNPFADAERERGYKCPVCEADSIEPCRAGTVTETVRHASLQRGAGRAGRERRVPILSVSDGETDETFIADLAVALEVPFFKAGPFDGMEYAAKYNRLVRIEEEMGETAERGATAF